MSDENEIIIKPEDGVVINPNLPTLNVDGILSYARSDEACFIRLCSAIPEGYAEQVRMVVSNVDLKTFIDVLCSDIDYYPKPKKTKVIAGTKSAVKEKNS